MGACIHAPWPWPRGDQKYIYIYRQTATKPRYYIRVIEITTHSGLGRFGAGGGLARDFEHHHPRPPTESLQLVDVSGVDRPVTSRINAREGGGG